MRTRVPKGHKFEIGQLIFWYSIGIVTNIRTNDEGGKTLDFCFFCEKDGSVQFDSRRVKFCFDDSNFSLLVDK